MARYFVSMITGVALLISGVLYANDRALWVWDKSDDIILNEKDRVEFYSFITAPHGNKNARITTIFISISPDFLISNRPAVQRFIADAHSRGISVQYLLGNNVFAMTDTNPATGMPYNQPLFDILDTSFFSYQIECAPQERFDALHVDIEPHGIGAESGFRKNDQPDEFWDWDNDTEALWSQFIDSLQSIQNAVNAHNLSYADSVQLGSDIPFWYDNLPNRNGEPSAGNQDVQNTVDFITIMNYEVRTDSVHQICADEIAYAELLGKPDSVIVGFETQEISAKTRILYNEEYGYLRGYGTIYLQTVSLWIFEGVEGTPSRYGDTETLVGIIESRYDSPPDNFSSSFRGTAFHYYENIANSENAYRSIGKRQRNSAPVCMLISPNGGEKLSGEETMRYRLYDVDNDAVLVRILIRMAPGQEWQAVSETVILSSVDVSSTVVFDTMNPLLYSGTSLNPGDAVTTAEMRIEVNELNNNGAVDNDGLSGFDVSDFPFSIVPVKHDVLAPFGNGVTIASVPAGGYPVHGSLLISWSDGFVDDPAGGANTSGIKGYWYSLYLQDQPERAYFTHGFLGSLPSAVAGLQDVYVWAEDYCGNRSSAVHAQITVYHDTDCDGIADVIDNDIDGDGISNTAELTGNTDMYSPLSFNTAHSVGEWDFRSDDTADIFLENSLTDGSPLRVTHDTADWNIIPDAEYPSLNKNLWMDSDKYVTLDLPDNTFISNVITALTVELWIKPDTGLRISSPFNFIPLCFVGDIDNGISLLLQNDARYLSLRFYHSGVSFIGSSGKFLSINVQNEPLFEDLDNDGISDQWHHVAFSYNGLDRVVKLFVDGVLMEKLQGGQVTPSIQSVNRTVRLFDARSSFDSDNYELSGGAVVLENVAINNSAQFESNYWEHIQFPSGRFIDNCKYGGLVNKIKITRAALPIQQTFLLEDSEKDGIPDIWETENGLNPYLNDADNDTDNDGLINIDEYNRGTNMNNSDTDNDGFLDGWEVSNGYDPVFDNSNTDTDNDGLTDFYEIQHSLNRYSADTDNDGLTDSEELNYGTNPLSTDTDNDGFSDRQETTVTGAEFVVNHFLPYNQSDPFAVYGSNEHLIVWQSENQDGDSGGIYGALLTSDVPSQDMELRINTVSAGNQSNPVAATDGNDYLIAWETENAGERSIAGKVVGSEFQAVISQLGNEQYTTLNNFRSGQMYYWGGYQAPKDGISTGIWMKFANGAGAVIHLGLYSDTGNGYPAEKIAQTQPVTLSAQFTGWQFFPFSSPVPVFAGEKYWFGWGHSNPSDIYIYYKIDTTNPAYRDYTWNPAQDYPSYALAGMNTHSSRAAVYLEYSFQGYALNESNAFSSDRGIQDNELNPSATYTGHSYVLVWEENDSVTAQIVENDGRVTGAPVHIIAKNAVSSVNPAIASSGVENLLVWKTDTGIAGQLFVFSEHTDVFELGNTFHSVTNNFPSGSTYYWGNYQVLSDGVSDGVWMKFRNGAGAAMQIALYEDSGSNYPGQKIALTEPVTVPSQVDGWFFFPFDGSVNLSASKKYWFAWRHNNSVPVYPYYHLSSGFTAYTDGISGGYPETALPLMGTHASRGAVYLEYNSIVLTADFIENQILIPVEDALSIAANHDGTAYTVSWEKNMGTALVRYSQRMDSSAHFIGAYLPVAMYSSTLVNAVISNSDTTGALMVWQEKITDDTYDIIGAFTRVGLQSNPLSKDTDGDGLEDYDELILYRSNPVDNDSDNDGITDNWELSYGTGLTNPDTDNDGLADGDELNWGTLLTNPDTDNDGLKDGYEILRGTSPLNPDTDSDGIPDGWETVHMLNPFAGDTDNDGQSDAYEVIAGSDPLDKSSRFFVEVLPTGLKWYCLPGKTYSIFVRENLSDAEQLYGQPIIGSEEGYHEFVDTGVDLDNDGDIDESDFLPPTDSRVKSRMYFLRIVDDMF